MELILKTNNENSMAKIIALAKKLNVIIEQPDKIADNKKDIEKLKQRILNFEAQGPSSFPDAAEWQQAERKDRSLPFSK